MIRTSSSPPPQAWRSSRRIGSRLRRPGPSYGYAPASQAPQGKGNWNGFYLGGVAATTVHQDKGDGHRP